MSKKRIEHGTIEQKRLLNITEVQIYTGLGSSAARAMMDEIGATVKLVITVGRSTKLPPTKITVWILKKFLFPNGKLEMFFDRIFLPTDSNIVSNRHMMLIPSIIQFLL